MSPEGSHAQGTVPERNFSGMGKVSRRWAVVRVKQSGQRCCSLSRRCWQLQPVSARTEKRSNGKFFLCMSKKSCIFAAEKERWLIQVAMGAAQGQPPLFLFIFPARYAIVAIRGFHQIITRFVFPNSNSGSAKTFYYLFHNNHLAKWHLLFVARLGWQAVHDGGRLQQLFDVEGEQC